jgi:hypothetical protein
MQKIRMFDIKWDTDGEDVELPDEMSFEVEDDFDVESEGADLLSDETGWCVFGFDFEIEAC